MSFIDLQDLVSATFAFSIGIITSSISLYQISNLKANSLSKKANASIIFALLLSIYMSFTFDLWQSTIIISGFVFGLITLLILYKLELMSTKATNDDILNYNWRIFKIINLSKNSNVILRYVKNQNVIYTLISIFVLITIFGISESQERENIIFPTYEYEHEERSGSITGGFVYRGENLPGLYGKYIYGDFMRSEIRTLEISNGKLKDNLLISSSENSSFVTGGKGYLRPVAFGTDNDNVYIVDHAGYLFQMNEAENGTFYLEKIFPDHLFNNPVGITQSNVEVNSFLIIEKKGVILKVNFDSKNITVLHNLTDNVAQNFYEQGLLGIALNPNTNENEEIYITYNSVVDENVHLSRLESKNGTYQEENILIINKEKRMHNGGHILFGPDGYLYMGTGDDNNPESASKMDNLSGKILRIDVQNRSLDKEYVIPNDNPYYKNSQDWREEIYAHGFRNPWKFSFDKETGELWLGDVGHKTKEEINIVVSGGDYGWPYFEGTTCYPRFSQCNESDLTFFYASIMVSLSFLSFYFSTINLAPLKNINKRNGFIFFVIGISTGSIWYYKTYLSSNSDWRDVDMILNVSTIVGFFLGIIVFLLISIKDIEKPNDS